MGSSFRQLLHDLPGRCEQTSAHFRQDTEGRTRRAGHGRQDMEGRTQKAGHGRQDMEGRTWKTNQRG